MFMKMYRRGSTRCMALFGALLMAIVCLYYISLANQSAPGGGGGLMDQDSKHKMFRNVLAHDGTGYASAAAGSALLQQQREQQPQQQQQQLQQCPRVMRRPSGSVDVDTALEYQRFDFQPAWMKTKEYWDEAFEGRYEASKKDPHRKPLKVILVPHSHNDPGWLKTFENYFESDTKNILNQLVNKMRQYEDMTFIWSEISFLQTWWDQVHPTKQKAFRKYVQSGRLEITTGGWVMTDEANVYLYAMWDQLVEGHQWVKTHLNVTPASGWSIDPFGHGSTFPYILANSGVKGAIVQRLHYAWKQWLAERRYGDFLWLTGWTDSGENTGTNDVDVQNNRDKRSASLVDGAEERQKYDDGDGNGQHLKIAELNRFRRSLSSEDREELKSERDAAKRSAKNKTKLKNREIQNKKKQKIIKDEVVVEDVDDDDEYEDDDDSLLQESLQYAYVSKNGKVRSDTEVSYEVRLKRSIDEENNGDGNSIKAKRAVKNPNKRPRNSILTHNMPFDIYSIKHSCGPHPYVCLNFDFRKVRGEYTEYSVKAQFIDAANVQSKAELLLEQYSRTASLFGHNVALIPLGDDFRYNHESEFDQQYTNYKLLVDYINSNRDKYGADIGFGTPKQYFDVINERTADFPKLMGDFFVYSDIFTEGRPAYWSGYFTTRPFLKILGRKLEHQLRNAEILFTVASNGARQNGRHDDLRLLEKRYELLVKARRNLGLFQHHDAITGTSKHAVMQDYGLKLFESLQNSIKIQQHAIESLLLDPVDGKTVRDFILHDLEQESYSKLERKVPVLIGPNKNPRQIVLFNSLPQERSEVVQVRVNTTRIAVYDSKNQLVRVQINPVWNTSGDDSKWAISELEYELMFVARIPALTLVTYTLRTKTYDDPKKLAVIYCKDCLTDGAGGGGGGTTKTKFETRPMQQGDVQMENPYLKLLFDGRTGFLKTITKKSILRTVQCALKFSAYHSAQFHSGAYLFKPDPNTLDPEKDPLAGYNEDVKILITTGPVASELTVTYGAFLKHTMRLYNVKNDTLSQAVYMENLVDFEQPPKNRETELFVRFETELENGDPPVFYTDSNGFQYQRRTKVPDIGIEGNYFPITAMTFIQDDKLRLSVLTDHAQGAASFEPGQLEVMLDRRTLYDDSRGMGEGLVDNRPTVFRNWLTLETVGETGVQQKHHHHHRRRAADSKRRRSRRRSHKNEEVETELDVDDVDDVDADVNGSSRSRDKRAVYEQVGQEAVVASDIETAAAAGGNRDGASGGEGEYQLPSLFSAQLADALNYPVNVYTVEDSNGSNSPSYGADTEQNPQQTDDVINNNNNRQRYVTIPADRSRVSLISAPLPCDVRLVNLRTMTDAIYPQFPASSALMMMHRQGYTCSVGRDVPHDCATSRFDPATGFRDLKLAAVTRTTLTGLEDTTAGGSSTSRSRSGATGLGPVDIEPMDLQTIRIDFQD